MYVLQLYGLFQKKNLAIGACGNFTGAENEKPSLEVEPTSLGQRTRQTTKNTSRRNVHL